MKILNFSNMARITRIFQIISLIFPLYTSCVRSVNIYISGETETIMFENAKSQFRFFIFYVNGHRFNHINQDTPNSLLSSFFHTTDDVLFTLRGARTRTFIPEQPFQGRFKRCVTEGICNLVTINASLDNSCLAGLDMSLRELGFDRLIPGCFEFEAFIQQGIAKAPHTRMRYNQPIMGVKDLQNFSTLALNRDGVPVHVFIHIANGVCISKIGPEEIFFHSIEEVLRFYKLEYEAEVNITRYRYRDDKDDDPPASALQAF